MVSFSWIQWLRKASVTLRRQKTRKPVVPQLRTVEGLEDRALLSANLPNAVDDSSYVVNEDQPLNGSSVLANDTDDDGDTIDTALLNTGVSNGALTLNPDGTFTYTPNPNFHGTDSFTYFAHDSLNNETSATFATVTITVDPIDDLSATDDSFTTDEDTPLSDSVATNDSTTSGGPLTYALDTPAANGIAAVNADGTFTYAPNANFHGSDSFTYTVTDADAGETATRTVSITVNAIDDLSATDDSFTTDEDTTLSDSVATNDSTTSGGTLAYALDSQASNGVAIVNADGTFTYTPNANFHGSDSFTYTVTDADANETATRTVSITVNAIDDLLATDDSFTTDEDTTLSDSVATNDSTTSGGTLAYALDSQASNGVVLMNPDGSFTYAPNANFHGSDSFSYTVTDASASESATKTVTITISSIDDLVALDDSFIVDEDGTLSDSVATNDSTTSGGPLNYALDTQASHGAVTFNADGSFTYTPDADFHGSDSFTYLVTDADSNESAVRMVSITVNSVNDVPSADPLTFSTDEDIQYSGVLTASDVDGDDLTFVVTSPATNGLVILNSDGTFTYTPDANFFGTDSFTYVVNDGTTDSLPTTVLITVTSVDDLTAVADSFTIDEDVPLSDSVASNDATTSGGTLTYALDSQASNGVAIVNADGTFTYTPNGNFHGTDSFTYTVTDAAAGESATRTVTIDVTAIDDLTATDDTFVIDEDTPLIDTVAGNDSTTSGGVLNYALDTQAAHGIVVVNADGSFVYTPDANFHGTDSFTYTVVDSDAGETATRTASITINSVDDIPVGDPLSFSTDEDTPYLGTVTASDAEGDPLTFAVATPAAHGTVTLALDGSFTYTPEANFHGSDSFTFVANDGTADSVAVTVTITVAAIDDLTANADSFTIDEDTALTDSLATNDSTTSGGTLSFALATQASHGIAVVNSDGTVTYTPDANFHGTDSFTYTVTDADAGESATRTVTITVNSVDDLVAVDDSFIIDEDGTLADSVATNDSTTSGGLLAYALETGASHGNVVVNADGSFTYTPDLNFHGSDSFTYTVTDAAASELATRTVSITVNAVNDAPVADGLLFTTTEDTPYSGTLTGSDVDGDALTFVLATPAAHGTVTVNLDGTFTYTPEANYQGSDSFTFVVNDGTVDSAVATVNITVTAANDVPTADAFAFATDEDTPYSGTLSGSDGDGDTLTFALATPAAHGVVTINADGTFTYTPDADFHGSDSFTFIVNDGQADSVEATVTITVNSVNDAPTATAQSFSTDEDTPYSGVLTGLDADGDALTFSAGSVAASHGQVTINADGTFTYTPAANFHGTDTFSFIVNDGTADSAEALVTITVIAVNDTPVASDGSFSGHKNNPVQGTLTATDVDGDSLTFTPGLIAPSHGSVTINPDGTFTYTPDADYFGTDTFSFLVSDGTVDSNEATVTITIANNQPPVANAASVQTNEDTVLTGTLTGSDADGDPLEFFLGSIVPSHGTVDVALDGSFTYTPAANFNGTDTFTFYVNDGIGNSAEVTVTITVIAVNDAPVADAITFSINEDTQLIGTLTGSDIDGDSLTFLAGAIQPSHGTVTINVDGTFVYTPADNYFGTDTFSFKVNDGTTDSAEVTVTITINPVNDTPTVSAGAATVSEDTVLNGSVSALGLDLDGDALTYVVVTPPAHGTLVLSPDGTFVYTPDLNYNGPDSFSFKANDGHVDSNVATFNITVSSVDDALKLTLPGSGAQVARNSVKVQLDPGASVSDVDTNVNYANAVIRAFISSGGTASDTKNGRFTLSVINQGTGPGLVKVKGSKIYFNGSKTSIGKISGGTKGQTLVITFNSTATTEAVNAVLKQLSAQASKKASPGVRTIGVRVQAGGQVADATQTVTVS